MYTHKIWAFANAYIKVLLVFYSASDSLRTLLSLLQIQIKVLALMISICVHEHILGHTKKCRNGI